MGRASSAKKIARAAKGSGRPGARRSLAWPATITAVVVVGILLLLLTVSEDDPVAVGPVVGEHWHAAYGINNCGTFVPNLVDIQPDDPTGIHTHGDGLIHMHPFSSRVSGTGANLDTWGLMTGLELTDTSIKAAGIDVENVDDCDGQPGVVQMKVWSSVADEVGRVVTEDLADYNPQDLELVTIAFLPAGADIPKPPAAAIASLDNPVDLAPTSTTTSSTTTTSTTTAG